MKTTTSKLLFISSIILALLLFRECSSKDCSAFEEPKGLISDATANSLEEGYKLKENIKNEIILGAGGTVIQDNREVWFELEEIENYIKYVKNSSDSLGYENLGLRVYFGAKEVDGVIKNTAFFVPTYSGNLDGEDEDPTDDDLTANPRAPGINSLNMGDPGMTEFVFP